MLRRRYLREDDKISTLKTIINNADIDKSKNLDKIVKAINNYCKASNASPAIKTNHEGDYIFTVDYAEYNNYYDNFKDNLKAFIKDLSDSMNDDKKDDKISTLKTINNALNADIDSSKNIDEIVLAINKYCKATKALPAIKKDYMFTVDCDEYNDGYDYFNNNLKEFINDLIDSLIADCKKGDEQHADDFIYWISSTGRRPLRGNDKISTLKTLKNDLNADIYRSKNIDEIVLAINKYCNAIKALPAIKKDYIFTVDCDEYNDYYDNFNDNLKVFIKDLIDSFIADCRKGDELRADDFIYWISSKYGKF